MATTKIMLIQLNGLIKFSSLVQYIQNIQCISRTFSMYIRLSISLQRVPPICPASGLARRVSLRSNCGLVSSVRLTKRGQDRAVGYRPVHQTSR